MLLLTGFDSYGQSLNKHNWYFGNTQRAIRFNRVTNDPSLITNKAVPFGSGGSAVATDRGSGNLLFYTDGNVIYDVNNKQMPAGAGLNANVNGNQPVAIVAIPGQTGKYFVFTNTANFTAGGTISYTVVDMNLFGTAAFPSPAFGDVEGTKNIAIAGLTNVAEGMLAVPHGNGTDFWLITQNVNSRRFNATLINAASYTAHTFNTIASTNAANVPTTIAHIAYHEGLKKLAVAPQEASTNAMVLNFDNNTGNIVFDRAVLNSGVLTTSNQQLYDVEWSPSGQYLYVSRHGEATVPADVLQYDYQGATTVPISLKSVLPAPIFRSYGLQRGPDSLIYHLYQSVTGGPFLLGRIDAPDSVAAKTHYNAAPAGFAGLDFDAKQFPGFVPNDKVTFNLDFTFYGTCQNSPTTFFPSVSPGADSLVWNIDAKDTAAWSPIHTFKEAGSFNVKLTAYYQGQQKDVTKPVQINAFPLTLQMPQDTTACKEEFPRPRGSSSPKQFSVKLNVQGGTPASIVWSNGDTGPILTPDSAGYYYAVVTDAGGCKGYKGVNVKEYGLEKSILNKWYFGDKAGIDFTGTPKALNESAMDAPEGCAIVCDKNGQQIFYTDGSTVWDKTHTVIATNIGGNPKAAQSSMIIPVPGDETIYYIFTTQDFNGSDQLQLKYSMFDLKENDGKGAVVQSNVLLYMKNTERITASGSWLIVHELGNSTFRSYPIGAGGIGNPVYTEIGGMNSAAIPGNADGYMKLGPNDMVAVPISSPGVGAHIELFHLNDTTGMLGQYKDIDLNDTNGTIYGIELFPANNHGNKLFASVRYSGGSSMLYEYFIDSLLKITQVQKIPVTADLGAIQTGPDGQVYVAVNNSGNNTSLGTIAPNGEPKETSSFSLNGFPLAGGTNSWLGLPNFMQQTSNQNQAPSITVTGLCTQDSARFAGSSRTDIDFFKWTVFKGTDVVATSTKATFSAWLPIAGDYRVSMQLHNRCGPDVTLTQDFKRTAPPFNPSKGVPLCNSPTATLDANPKHATGLTFEWATGETTETLAVSEPGIYQVKISDEAGCKTTGNFVAADSRPIFDLGPDVTVCEGTVQPSLNVRNPTMTHAWKINNVAIPNTGSTQSVDTTVPHTISYTATVTDPVTTCFRTDTVTFIVNKSPDFTLTPTNPSSCGANDGSVRLDLAGVAADGPFTYFISGPDGSTNGLDATAPNNFTLTGLGAGTYSGIVRDQVSECTISQSVGLSDATFAVNTVQGLNCDPVPVNVTTTVTNFPLTWKVTNGGTGATTNGNSSGVSFPITPLVEGDYTLEVTDNLNCVKTATITITPDPKDQITITPDLCTMKLSASGAATYVWSTDKAGAIVGSNTANPVTLNPTAGTVEFTVVGSGGAGCPGTEKLTLDVGAVPTPALSQTTGCSDLATISVTPSGNFNYRWFVNGTFDITYGGSSILVNEADNGKVFRVQILEPQSGCTKNSTDLTAEVVGEVDASLSSTPPCADGLPITLTANTTDPAGASYAWSRDGSALSGVTTAQTQQTDEGNYQVEISKGSCKATSALAIVRAALPEGDLPNIAIICDDPENTDPDSKQVKLDPGSFSDYDWIKNGISLAFNEEVYTADSKGTYEVVITNAAGCKATDKTDVLNECLPRINAPNAFRPGSLVFNPDRKDLTNGDFWILTRFIQDDQFKVFIFNRWGEMVFSSTDRFFKWNGGFNNDIGRPAPPGTYSYVVQYVSAFRPSEGVKEKRGGVALIR